MSTSTTDVTPIDPSTLRKGSKAWRKATGRLTGDQRRRLIPKTQQKLNVERSLFDDKSRTKQKEIERLEKELQDLRDFLENPPKVYTFLVEKRDKGETLSSTDESNLEKYETKFKTGPAVIDQLKKDLMKAQGVFINPAVMIRLEKVLTYLKEQASLSARAKRRVQGSRKNRKEAVAFRSEKGRLARVAKKRANRPVQPRGNVFAKPASA